MEPLDLYISEDANGRVKPSACRLILPDDLGKPIFSVIGRLALKRSQRHGPVYDPGTDQVANHDATRRLFFRRQVPEAADKPSIAKRRPGRCLLLYRACRDRQLGFLQGVGPVPCPIYKGRFYCLQGLTCCAELGDAKSDGRNVRQPASPPS